MSGFIVIHRKIFENPLFAQNPIARQVFEDLVKLAAWKECHQDWRGKPVFIDRGQVMISVSRIAEITGRSIKQVRTALAKCEAHEMLILGQSKGKQLGNARGKAPGIITICNYTQYQDLSKLAGNANGNQPETKGQIKEPKITNKPKKELSSFDDDVRAAFEKFEEFAKHTGLPCPAKLSAKRKQKIKSRLDEHGLEKWTEALRQAYRSEFIRSARWFTIDWLAANETNITKVLEGNYDNQDKPHTKTKEEQADDRFAEEMRRKYLVNGVGEHAVYEH